jgi:GxxExxY protein
MHKGVSFQQAHPRLEVLATQVIGAAIEVHKTIGPGYLESVYEEALCRELVLRQITFSRQHEFFLTYKGFPVGQGRLDLLVADCLVVELKAIEAFTAIHQAQVISYLRALNLHLGLLINFNVSLLKNGIRRVVVS